MLNFQRALIITYATCSVNHICRYMICIDTNESFSLIKCSWSGLLLIPSTFSSVEYCLPVNFIYTVDSVGYWFLSGLIADVINIPFYGCVNFHEQYWTLWFYCRKIKFNGIFLEAAPDWITRLQDATRRTVMSSNNGEVANTGRTTSWAYTPRDSRTGIAT